MPENKNFYLFSYAAGFLVVVTQGSNLVVHHDGGYITYHDMMCDNFLKAVTKLIEDEADLSPFSSIEHVTQTMVERGYDFDPCSVEEA